MLSVCIELVLGGGHHSTDGYYKGSKRQHVIKAISTRTQTKSLWLCAQEVINTAVRRPQMEKHSTLFIPDIQGFQWDNENCTLVTFGVSFKDLDIMMGMAEDENFPANYDYCISVLENSPYLTTSELTYDQRFNHKDVRQQVTWPRMIVIFMQWANLEGDQQNYNSDFIDKILIAAGITDEESVKKLVIVPAIRNAPMTTLSGSWIIPIEREFDLPYIKRVYSSNSGFQRLKDRIDNGYNLNLNLSAQFQHFGGSNSRFFRNTNSKLFQDGKYLTSFSWRDTRLVCTMMHFTTTTYTRRRKDGRKETMRELEIQRPNFAKMTVAFCGARTIWT
jgi:hypothetical protein